MKRENSVVILKALLMGITIEKSYEKDSAKYCMDEDFNICRIDKMYRNDVYQSDVLVKINFGDFTISQFVNWCNSFTIEEVAIINMDMVLNMEK